MKASNLQCVKEAKAAALYKFRHFYRVMGIPEGNAMLAFSPSAKQESPPIPTKGQAGEGR